MAKRTASAVWEGTLREGKGKVKLGSGAFEGQYSFASRFEEGTGTNPEELIGAAHAGCFSMALAASIPTLTLIGRPMPPCTGVIACSPIGRNRISFVAVGLISTAARHSIGCGVSSFMWLSLGFLPYEEQLRPKRTGLGS